MNSTEKYEHLLKIIDSQEKLISEQNKTIRKITEKIAERENMIEIITMESLK